MEILLKDQRSCVINNARRGRPIPLFLFILALEILLLLMKTKPKIAGQTILDHCYLYSAYADDLINGLEEALRTINRLRKHAV